MDAEAAAPMPRPAGACAGTNARGEPCRATRGVEGGYCLAHQPGGLERLRAMGSRGGRAKALRDNGAAFTLEELGPVETIEDAKRELVQVRNAVLIRKITHAEGQAATKALEAWIKADTQAVTRKLVTELQAQLDAKEEKIRALQERLTSPARGGLRSAS